MSVLDDIAKATGTEIKMAVEPREDHVRKRAMLLTAALYRGLETDSCLSQWCGWADELHSIINELKATYAAQI